MVAEVEGIVLEGQDGLLPRNNFIRNRDVILLVSANRVNGIVLLRLDKDQLSVLAWVGWVWHGLEKNVILSSALLKLAEVEKLEQLSLAVLESGRQRLVTNFAPEVMPDEGADVLALGHCALVLSQPSLQTVEVNEAHVTLASAWVDQWIALLRLVGAVKAHSASLLAVTGCLIVGIWNQFSSLHLKIVNIGSSQLRGILLNKHVSDNELGLAEFYNVVLFQFIFLGLRLATVVWQWPQL